MSRGASIKSETFKTSRFENHNSNNRVLDNILEKGLYTLQNKMSCLYDYYYYNNNITNIIGPVQFLYVIDRIVLFVTHL